MFSFVGAILSFFLLAAAAVLFLGKRWISDQSLQRFANACAVAVLIVSALVFVLPPTTPVDPAQRATDNTVTRVGLLPTKSVAPIVASFSTLANPRSSSPSPTVYWTVDVTGVPNAGDEISWRLDAGFVLMFGGNTFEFNGARCQANPAKEICIMLFKATRPQTVVIRKVRTQDNRIGITPSLNPVDALDENERLLWRKPNCGNGCSSALIYYFTDGQLTRTETRTAPPADTLANTVSTPTQAPRGIPSPTRYSKDNVTVDKLGTRHISLAAGELIAGTADRFQDDVNKPGQPPCTAFVIKGPIEMDLTVWYAGWDYWGNVYDDSIVLSLLQEKVQWLKNHHQTCPSRGINAVMLP